MIVNQCNVNPLKDIIDILPETWIDLDNTLVSNINKLLFQAGIACESDNETITCIDLLRQIEIIDIDSGDAVVHIKRGKNGKNIK